MTTVDPRRAVVGRSRQRAGWLIAKTSLGLGVVAFMACALLAPPRFLAMVGAFTFMGAVSGVWLACIGIIDEGPPEDEAPPK